LTKSETFQTFSFFEQGQTFAVIRLTPYCIATQQSMSQQQRFLPDFVIDRLYDIMAWSGSRLVDIAAFFSVANGGEFSANAT
jgi:hypothetical protein